MRPRFLLVAADGPEAGNLATSLARRTGLEPVFVQPSLAALASPSCRCLRLREEGVVLGTLFPRHGRARPTDELDEVEADVILKSAGGRLLTRFWGGYVAALRCGRGLRILRDPSAALPCYSAINPGIAAFASDADLLLDAGFVQPVIDWQALARHFYRAGVPAPETALRGIEELLPGHALELPNGTTQTPCWSPWEHVELRPRHPDEAAEQLGRIVRQCVAGWAAPHDRLLASVSGGLDSSLVLASLAEAGAETIGLTMYGEDPGGDERVYARALCRHVEVRLLERPYRLEDIDLGEPLAPHLPRPMGRTQALAYERAHIAAAREVGASAFVTGNGGDSVFGHSQSAAAIADRYLTEGLSAGLVATLRDVCRQTGASASQAAWSAIRIARGPRAYHCRPTPLFLHPDLLSGLRRMRFDHAWLEAPASALPGKAAHIASVLRVQQCLEPGRSRHRTVLNPLMSQPIIEACLAIPSWAWRAGGRDRSVARAAFAGAVPDLILQRRVKGGPDAFAARLLDRYRSAIRERLLDGWLAREGLLDRRALEETLAEERPVPGDRRVRILELVAAESWLGAWRSRAADPALAASRPGG